MLFCLHFEAANLPGRQAAVKFHRQKLGQPCYCRAESCGERQAEDEGECNGDRERRSVRVREGTDRRK